MLDVDHPLSDAYARFPAETGADRDHHELFDIGLVAAASMRHPRAAHGHAPMAVHATSTPSRTVRGAILKCAAFLYLGLVGACIAAGAVLPMGLRERPFVALTMVVGGGALAIASWQYAYRLLRE